MKKLLDITYMPYYLLTGFFSVFFLYFFKFNAYHLIYLEQKQLFCYDRSYFASFLSVSGGLSDYAGAFLIQFIISPFMGAIIMTFIGIAVYFLSFFIFRKFGIKGIFWSLIPVLFIAGLHSDHLYGLGYSAGFIFTLVYVAIYISVRKNGYRYLTGFIGWIFLYMVTGIFSLPAILICIIFESLINNARNRFLIVIGYILLAFLFPYLAWRFVFFQTLSDTWLRPLFSLSNVLTRYTLYGLLAYIPLSLLIMLIIFKLRGRKSFTFRWNWLNIIAAMTIVTGMSILIMKYYRDTKMELLLHIDHSLQKSDWDKALELCSEYPETHRMIVYFTNIALLKSGNMGDRMFHYTQVGPEGLSLPWTTNSFIPFFGNDIFYHLGYINEAYHWAFEAIVANGNCPRLVKRIVMTSLINGNNAVAEKYLKLLSKTIYYRGWANHYLKLINDPELIEKDAEISEKRKFLIRTDFFAGDDNSELSLNRLLENQPYNRLVFEYFMASLLLEKDILSFISNIDRIKEFGYKQIPVHYEEAMIWYMSYSKQDIMPEGFDIRQSTLQRFLDYADAYSSYNGAISDMARSFKKYYGTTYWYYYHFVNYQKALK